MKKFFVVVGFFLLAPFSFSDAAPAVSSFSSSASSQNSGAVATFSWSMTDASGYSFSILCATGVKFTKIDGSIYTCGTEEFSTSNTSGSFGVFVYNVSGGTQTIRGRVMPKDPVTQANVSGALQEATVNILTATNPITSFTASKTETVSGEDVTVSWTSEYLDGVNLKIECRNEIKVSSPNFTSTTYMPCDNIIFSTDLGASGSLTLGFKNSSSSKLPYTLTLLPAVSAGSYDATHAKTLNMSVASDVLPDPVVKTFLSDSATVYSGEGATVSWTTENSKEANIRISCAIGISATSTESAEALACGVSAFKTLAASGSQTFSFFNSSGTNRVVTLTLLPAKKIGEYDALRAKDLNITVRPPRAEDVVETSTPPVPLPVLPPPAVISPPATKPASPPAVKSPASPPVSSMPVPPIAPLQESSPSGQGAPSGIPQAELSAPALDDKGRLPVVEKEIIPSALEFLDKETAERLTNSIIGQGVADSIVSYAPKAVSEKGDGFKTFELIGTKRVKLFWIIPLSMSVNVEVDTEGRVQNVKTPWWGFLVR